MANISDAYGTITLQGPWKSKHTKVLLYALFSLDVGGDYTTIISHEDFEYVYRKLIKETEISFIGSGRWTYETNLNYFDEWSKSNPKAWERKTKRFNKKYMITHKKYLKKLKWLKKQMFHKNLYLNWDYMDMEIGASFISRSLGMHKSIRTERSYYLSYTEDVVESYDCNLKNACEYFFESDDYLIEAVEVMLALYDRPDLEDAIVSFIKDHDTWYDLSASPYFDKKTDIPSGIRSKIIKLIREQGNDNK